MKIGQLTQALTGQSIVTCESAHNNIELGWLWQKMREISLQKTNNI